MERNSCGKKRSPKTEMFSFHARTMFAVGTLSFRPNKKIYWVTMKVCSYEGMNLPLGSRTNKFQEHERLSLLDDQCILKNILSFQDEQCILKKKLSFHDEQCTPYNAISFRIKPCFLYKHILLTSQNIHCTAFLPTNACFKWKFQICCCHKIATLESFKHVYIKMNTKRNNFNLQLARVVFQAHCTG